MLPRLAVVAPLAAVFMTLAGPAAAAPCDCDHVLELADEVVSGADLGVQPGQSVCVRGGLRPFLRLQGFVGAEGQAIEVRNCEGQVEIDNDDRGYGLTVDRSRHVRVTGAGDPEVDYGFKVRASRTGPDYAASGVLIGDLSTNIEVDHIESYDSGFAGFVIKTDPRCDGSANLGNFVMYDSRVHHNYIHDTRGEGIYFGSTGYGGRTYTCDGEEVTLYPHEHHGAQIHDNIIHDTGWDGAQIGVTPVDCAFYRNTIINVGLEGEQYQQQGLQVGGASACAIWGNVLMDGPTNGLFIFGADDTQVYNNLVVGFAGTGIYINDQGQDLAAKIWVAHNTVIASGERGIAVFGALLGPGFARNNAVAEAVTQLIGIGGDVPAFVDEGNHTAEDAASLGFVDVAARDFHLTADSPLRDASVAVPELMVPDDLDAVPRDDGAPDVGAFEFTETTSTTGGPTTGDPTTGDPTTGDPGPGTTTTGNGTTTEDGGDSDSDSDATSPTGADGPTGGGPATGSTGGASATAGSATADEPGETDTSGCACANSRATRGPLWSLLLTLAAFRRRRRG